MAYACRLAGLRCVAVVPEGCRAPQIRKIAELGATLVRVGSNYEDAVKWARALCLTRGLYDANPGGGHAAARLRGYRAIAAELYDELRDAPAAIALPVSNGTTLAGVHRGFVSLERRGRTCRVPRIIAGSGRCDNPIVAAFRTSVRVEVAPVDGLAIDGQLALDAIWASGGWASGVSDRRMQELSRWLRLDQGLEVLPASTAGLAALLARHVHEALPPDCYVAILTGRTL